MVIINEEWLTDMNEMADRAEADHSYLSIMTDEQLSYLVYWNWGYSGPVVEVAREAEKLLIARGVDYNTLGEQINAQTEQYI